MSTRSVRSLAIMVAQGNPHRIAAPADLAKPGVRLVRRPEGAGAPTQLRRVLDAAKIRLERLTVEAPPAVTESEAAVAILGAKAHAGIALRAVGALFFRLDFIPLRGERFDLAIRRRDSSRRYRGWASPARRTSPRRRLRYRSGRRRQLQCLTGAVGEEPSDPPPGADTRQRRARRLF